MKRFFVKSLFTLLLVAGLMAVNANATTTTGSGFDNNRWSQDVRLKLATAMVMLDIAGNYEPSHETALGSLRTNTYDEWTYTLQAGVDYYFIGECDQDCTDLDIKLYDENYNLVDQDVKPDNTPVVHVTPKWTGTFHMRAIMSRCVANPCYWGVGAYQPK